VALPAIDFRAGADELDAALAEASLAEFIRIGWKWMDPAEFRDNWHIDVVAERLEAVVNGECTRLIINLPPRHMKSLLVSVAFNAWVWAQKPDPTRPLAGPGVAFLTMSYAQSLSMRDSVKTRRLIKSPWYQRLFGDRFAIAHDQDAKLRFENNHNGYRLASSVDGSATGEGGDIIVIDDAINAKDALSETIRNSTNDWFDNTMTTRLNDPKRGAFVLMMQRLHENDLVGHVLSRDEEWEHLCLPARYEINHPHLCKRDRRTKDGELLWESRFGETELKRIEKLLGSYGSAGQLQQRPAPREGGMLKPEWFRILRKLPHDAFRFVRAWDFAATEKEPGADPDWTAGLRMAATRTGKFIITGVNRFRASPLIVDRRMLLQAAADGVETIIRIPQDPGAAGKADVAHKKRKLRGYGVRGEPVSRDKAARATPLAAAAEAGDIFLLVTGDPEQDAWIQPFLDECAVFPFGRHDDQVDAASDAYNELTLGKVTLFDAD
jgi:predicted phage terminase large subunit-like protein